MCAGEWRIEFDDERALAHPGRPPAGGRVALRAANLQAHEGAEAKDVVAAALAEVDAGASWVKVIADFPGPDWNWFTPIACHEPSALLKLADAVHLADARIAANVFGPLVADVVAAGIDSVEHGPLVDADLVREMAERGTAWTPTFSTIAPVIDRLARGGRPAATVASRVLVELGKAIPVAVELGVPVLTGTDEAPHGTRGGGGAAVPVRTQPGASAHLCFDDAARLSRAPRARAGAPADLVTYDADPRQEPAALLRPAAVVLGGRRVG